MAKKKTEKEYLEKFINAHNNFYTYEPFPEIFNQKTKISIICPEHGQFSQTINNHSNGMGCPRCAKTNMSSTKVSKNPKRMEYESKIKEFYGDEYDFSQSNFNTPYDSKIVVLCKTCKNKQEKRISDLLKHKAGCSFCRIEKMQKGYYQELRDYGKEMFIKRASELYNNKYDYSEIDYKGNSVPVKIICPEHGEFYKRPNLHIYNLEDCPICRAESNYSAYEDLVARYFDKNSISYIPQFYVKEDDYLKNKAFDFYLEKFNLLVEIDGPQHRRCCWDMTEEDLEKRKEIDKNKTEKAIELNFNIIRISTDDDIIKILKEELDKLIKFNDYPVGE